jgi:hypothetical protein
LLEALRELYVRGMTRAADTTFDQLKETIAVSVRRKEIDMPWEGACKVCRQEMVMLAIGVGGMARKTKNAGCLITKIFDPEVLAETNDKGSYMENLGKVSDKEQYKMLQEAVRKTKGAANCQYCRQRERTTTVPATGLVVVEDAADAVKKTSIKLDLKELQNTVEGDQEGEKMAISLARWERIIRKADRMQIQQICKCCRNDMTTSMKVIVGELGIQFLYGATIKGWIPKDKQSAEIKRMKMSTTFEDQMAIIQTDMDALEEEGDCIALGHVNPGTATEASSAQAAAGGQGESVDKKVQRKEEEK